MNHETDMKIVWYGIACVLIGAVLGYAIRGMP
jgi:hypothetical protein